MALQLAAAHTSVTDLSGQYYYARTYAEHQTNCQKAADVNRSLAAKK